jgi:hypothetical protein
MTRSLEYLNTTMRFGRFYLVEVVRLVGQDLAAHAAQVVATPPKKIVSSGSLSSSQANEADFLLGIDDDHYRDAMKSILSTCDALGLTIYWGAKGASVRMPTPDRTEPLSIGWAFLDGDQWFGAKHLTLGVDQSSLAQTPTVRSSVLAFVGRVGAIAGAKQVTTKLDAHTFEPDVVPAAKDEIVEALETLVEAVQSGDGKGASLE